MDNNNEVKEEEIVKAEEIKEQQDKENEALYNKAIEKLNTYRLEWTIRSINYVLNKENSSFGQLRSCTYRKGEDVVFDYIKSTLLLIKAGLVGSKQVDINEPDKLENMAYDIMEDWRSNIGTIGVLHLLIINQMEIKHFFMGMQEMGIVNHLSSKNLQKDLVQNIVMEDLEEKVKQAQALSGMN